MSDFFYHQMSYGAEIAMEIQEKMDVFCKKCGDYETCSDYKMMHRSDCMPENIYEGIDFSKAPSLEERGMVVVDTIGGFQIIANKGTVLDPAVKP